MPHSVLNKELGKFREFSGCSRLDRAKTYCGKQWCVWKSVGFRVCNIMLEKEIVTGVTVCIKLLSRFRESLCAGFKERPLIITLLASNTRF